MSVFTLITFPLDKNHTIISLLQVIAAQGGVESNTATTYFEFFDQVQKDVAKRRLCSTCQIIKGGKRCLPTSTTSSDAYREVI